MNNSKTLFQCCSAGNGSGAVNLKPGSDLATDKMIEKKGLDFDHDFGYSFPLFSFLLKKRGKKKRSMNSKNRDQNSCLSALSDKFGAEDFILKAKLICSGAV